MPRQPPPPCAQGESDRHLALALQRSREQQVCDVGARDEQHDDRNGGEPQRHLGILRDLRAARGLHRPDQRDGVGIAGLPKLSGPLGILRAQSDRRLALRRTSAAGSKPSDKLHEVGSPIQKVPAHQLGRGNCEGNPDIDVLQVDAREPLGRDADHFISAASELEPSPENAGVPTESPFPEFVAEHGDRGAAETVFVGEVEAS